MFSDPNPWGLCGVEWDGHSCNLCSFEWFLLFWCFWRPWCRRCTHCKGCKWVHCDTICLLGNKRMFFADPRPIKPRVKDTKSPLPPIMACMCAWVGNQLGNAALYPGKLTNRRYLTHVVRSKPSRRAHRVEGDIPPLFGPFLVIYHKGINFFFNPLVKSFLCPINASSNELLPPPSPKTPHPKPTFLSF